MNRNAEPGPNIQRGMPTPTPEFELDRCTPESPDRTRRMIDMLREISRQTDPQQMISVFRKETPWLYGGTHAISLSRRGVEPPTYKITRSTTWDEELNPWENPHVLPVFEGGLLGELLYGDEPRVMRNVRVTPGDPAIEYLTGVRSLVAMPLFDGGVGVNMVVRTSTEVDTFDSLNLADSMLVANLFGKATSSLVTATELAKAYARIDHELKLVSRIQRSLLPPSLPKMPGVDIAASYKTATRAGGDYYDFFPLEDDRWGILIADVSGHGTAAAVVMAMLRTILHGLCQDCGTTGEILTEANERIANHSDKFSNTFVTAWYGVLDPKTRSLEYSSAGHNPPLVVDRNIDLRELSEAQSVPLGIDRNTKYDEVDTTLSSGDTLVLYTDGITEASSPTGEMYGHLRLLDCIREDVPNAQHIIDCITHKLIGFTGGVEQADDQTLVALRFT